MWPNFDGPYSHLFSSSERPQCVFPVISILPDGHTVALTEPPAAGGDTCSLEYVPSFNLQRLLLTIEFKLIRHRGGKHAEVENGGKCRKGSGVVVVTFSRISSYNDCVLLTI